MTEKPQDLHGLDPEEEIRQLFQQLPPVAIPDDTYENIHALLMNEVANTLSVPSQGSRKPQFPFVGWLQRQFQRVPRFELGPSLAAAAMGAAVILLLVGFYPAFKNFITPDARVTVLYSNSSTQNDVSVLIQRGYGESIELSEGDESTIQAGDKLVAWSSNVAIEYAEGWKSILKADSILDIESLSRGRTDVDIGLFLLDGEIYTSIERDLGFDGHIAVRTDSSLVEAVGTEFIVRTDTQDISYVAVLTGTVQMSAGTNSVSIDGNEQVLGVTGQSLEVSPLPESIFTDVDLTEPYVTTKNGAVALYAKPDVNSTKLAEMKAADRMKLIAASNDEKWYVVCCIRQNVLTWANSVDVVPHGPYGELGKFPDLLPGYDATDNMNGTEGTNSSALAEPTNGSAPVANAATADSGTADSTGNEAVRTALPTGTIPSTSTPVFTFTPPDAEPTDTTEAADATEATEPTRRPAPPFLRPVLPLPSELVSSELVPLQPNTTEASPEGLDNPAGAVTPTSTPTSIRPPQEGSSGDEDVASDEQSPPQVLSEPTEAQTNINIDGTGGIDVDELLPTNTGVPNTPTSTRRPNRSTNTPIPQEPVATAVPLLPATAVPSNTPGPTASAPLVPANTPVPTSVAPTAIPATATPIPEQPTATNTRRPNTSTNTPVVQPTNTPVSVAPTNTPVILPPTNTPVPTSVEPPVPPTATPTVQIEPPTAVPTVDVPTNSPTPVPPAPTNTPVVIPPTATNTATPQIVEPTAEPAVTSTSTLNPKLTSPTEPPDEATSLPAATSAPLVETPTSAPPEAPTVTPQIVVPTPTPAS